MLQSHFTNGQHVLIRAHAAQNNWVHATIARASPDSSVIVVLLGEPIQAHGLSIAGGLPLIIERERGTFVSAAGMRFEIVNSSDRVST